MKFTGELYPFQQPVFDWARQINRGIMALDMGLGKTIITVAIICAKQFQHCLIVVPLPVVKQWSDALVSFTDLSPNQICFYHGRRRNPRVFGRSKYKVILTTYEMIRIDINNGRINPEEDEFHFDCVIFDEAQKLRNGKTQTHQTCYRMSQKISSRWLLSGTPIVNQYQDIIILNKFLDLDLDQDLDQDQDQGLGQKGDSTSGSLSNSDRISQWKKKYYYRLMKCQCQAFLSLPGKEIHCHTLTMTEDHWKYYQCVQQELVGALADLEGTPEGVREGTPEGVREGVREGRRSRMNFTSILVKILRLKQCCNHVNAMIGSQQFADKGGGGRSEKKFNNNETMISSVKFDTIMNLYNQKPKDQKMVIFSQWEVSLNILGQYFKSHGIDYLLYHGQLSMEQRQKVLDQFRTDTITVLLMTLTSGGLGLNLTCANHVILMDSWWNQATENQAIDRVYRIGQTRKVEVHRLVVNNTIEQWLVTMKEEKNKTVEYFDQYDDIYHVNRVTLSALLRRYL